MRTCFLPSTLIDLRLINFLHLNISLRTIRQHVFVLAASNLPWDLDQALLRRLEKRIFVPMPNEEARKRLLKSYLSSHVCQLTETDFDDCAQNAVGYNGADIKLLCKEAVMRPVRAIFKKLEQEETKASAASTCKTTTIPDLKGLMAKHPVTSADLKSSLNCTKPSTDPKVCIKYKEWSDSHGAN